MAPPSDSDNPFKQLGLYLPVPLNVRLDRLLERVAASGERSSRRELVAALIHSAPRSGADMHRLVREFRSAPAEAAVLEGDDFALYRTPEARPGPRSQRREDATQWYALVDLAEGPPDDIRPDTPLRSAPARRVGLSVPRPLDARLGQLVRAVVADYGQAGKGEVLDALVLGAPEDGGELVERVQRLRAAERRRQQRVRPVED